jgi:hypothetical protein
MKRRSFLKRLIALTGALSVPLVSQAATKPKRPAAPSTAPGMGLLHFHIPEEFVGGHIWVGSKDEPNSTTYCLHKITRPGLHEYKVKKGKEFWVHMRKYRINLMPGDKVKHRDPSGLHCGAYIYDHAIVKSVDPLVLVSEHGDMTWRYTIDSKDLIILNACLLPFVVCGEIHPDQTEPTIIYGYAQEDV